MARSAETFLRRNRAFDALSLSTVAMFAALAVPATAQTTPPTGASEGVQETGVADGNDWDGAGGEIIVTAQKRSESLSKVGVTISAFEGDSLKNQGVRSVRDLVSVVPGLTYAQSSSATPVYTLRGVGYFENSLAASPAVSVYSDQVPLPFPILTQQVGFDLERVEVLKGPQGILFGQNSTGGAINYIAKKPTSDLNAGFDLSYGRFNTIDGTAYVSGPLGDMLSARVAAHVEHGGDWQRSQTRDDTIGRKRVYAGRMIVDWEASDALKFELNLNGMINKSDPLVGQFLRYTPVVAGGSAPGIEDYEPAPDNARIADWSPLYPPKLDQKMYQISLRGDYDVSGDLTLTSITSYVDFKRDDFVGDAGVAGLNLNTVPATGKIKDFFQELRLANGSENRLRFTLGANYEWSKVHEESITLFADSTAAPVFGFDSAAFFNTQRTNTYAAFGNLDFSVTDQLTLKGGLRYTKAVRDNAGCGSSAPDGGNGAFYAGLSTLLTGNYIPPIPTGECITLNVPSFVPQLFVDKLDEDNVSWRGGIDYQVTPETLLYVNVSRGYKAGSYPVLPASTSPQLVAATQETVLAYEAGFKTQLLDRKLYLSGAIFRYDYKDKQSLSKLIDPVVGLLDTLVNVPKSRIMGAELSANLRPIDGLSLTGSVTYLDTEVKRFTGINNDAELEDFTGSRLPFAPDWQTSASADYQWSVFDGYTASIGASMQHHSSATSAFGKDPLYRIAAYTTVDLRASIASDAGWKVQAWGKNVTNEFYYTNVSRLFDTTVRYAGLPVTYGLTFSYDFR